MLKFIIFVCIFFRNTLTFRFSTFRLVILDLEESFFVLKSLSEIKKYKEY